MKKLIYVLMMLIAVSSQAAIKQDIFLEKTLWSPVCTFVDQEDARRIVENGASNRCNGDIRRISDWVEIPKKPIDLNFCYEIGRAAIFECLTEE